MSHAQGPRKLYLCRHLFVQQSGCAKPPTCDHGCTMREVKADPKVLPA